MIVRFTLAIALAVAGAACGGPEGDERESPAATGQDQGMEGEMDFRLPFSKRHDPSVLTDIQGKMIAELDELGRNEDAILAAATGGQQILYVLMSVEGDINTGGFDSLLRYRSGDWLPDAVQYARELGAHRHAQILQRAVAIFPSPYPEDTNERFDYLDSIPEEQSLESLGELDEAWYRLDSLDSYLQAYIDDHPEEFFISGT